MVLNGISRSDCPAYVLAGGHSRRFGSSKARVRIDGITQIECLTETLLSHGHEVIVVAADLDDFRDLKLRPSIRVIADREPDMGPMMGVATALADRVEMSQRTKRADESIGREIPSREMPSQCGWLLALSVDQFLWERSWFEILAAEVQGPVEAVTFRYQEDHENRSRRKIRTQPLPGLFHVRLAPMFEQALARRQLALRSLVEAANSKCIFHDDNPSDWSFNDPATLQDLIRRASKAKER